MISERISMTQTPSKKKFGTFAGIFVPNVTMMFGVILFLRLGMIIGHVGPWQFAAIVAISLALMIITSFSIAMIATNMKVGKGGVYYLISRSLGIEIGSAVGLALCLSQLVCLSLCISAFAYSFILIYPNISLEIVEIVTLSVLTIVSLVSVNLAIRAQTGIFIILFCAAGSIFFGSMDGIQLPGEGIPSEPYNFTFWKAFALFYPAMTGIEAGMAMSGSLRNPSRSLTWGNISSLLVVGFTYFFIGLFIYFSIPSYLLREHPFLLINFSPWEWLIYLGIWCAAISSSLGCLIGCSRMVQSLAGDGVLPTILGKGYGANNEPRWATALTFFVSLILVFFTTMDQIIPVLTMICLISYGTLNFVAAVAQLINNPGWRPTFTVPWYIPMFGAVGAISLMFLIDAAWTFLAIGFVLAIYFTMKTRNLKVSFPDLRESIIFFFSRKALYRLAVAMEHPLNWHPQILACTGAPAQQLSMLYLASSFTKRSGILTTVSIVPKNWEDSFQLERTKKSINEFLSKQGILSLVEVSASSDSYQGIDALIRNYGIGPLQPNTILIGLPERIEAIKGLLNVMRTASFCKKNLMLFHSNVDSSEVSFYQFLRNPKSIDVWWDSNNTESFELMVSFVVSFTSGISWNRKMITFKSLAPNENAANHIRNYLNRFIRKSRISAQTEVIVEEESQTVISGFSKYSTNADLIFVPLLTLGNWPQEEEEKALGYLQELEDALPSDKMVVLLSRYDDLEHRKIYM